MAEQHGLRVLQVGHAGCGQVAAGGRLVDQRGLQLGQPARDQPDVVPQVKPQVGGHLVVAAAAGPQLAAQRAEPLEQPPFERGVHVLVGHRGPERPVGAGPVQVFEGLEHRAQLGVGQQPGPVQHPGVGPGGPQVVPRQPPVELNAD